MRSSVRWSTRSADFAYPNRLTGRQSMASRAWNSEREQNDGRASRVRGGPDERAPPRDHTFCPNDRCYAWNALTWLPPRATPVEFICELCSSVMNEFP